jgi:hypothetical protein
MAVNFARILPRRPRPKALVAARARSAMGPQALIIRLSLQGRRMELALGPKSAYSDRGALLSETGPEDRLVLSIFGDGSTPIHGGEKYHRVMAKKVKEVPFTFNPAIKAN